MFYAHWLPAAAAVLDFSVFAVFLSTLFLFVSLGLFIHGLFRRSLAFVSVIQSGIDSSGRDVKHACLDVVASSLCLDRHY